MTNTLATSPRRARGKHLWITKSQKLLHDARRDWRDLGGDPNDVIPQDSFKLRDPIPRRPGILFTTYSTLRSGHGEVVRNEDTKEILEFGPKSRLKQIVDWIGGDPKEYDGTIIFDESHACKQSTDIEGDGGFTREASQTAIAAEDLQRFFPKAKVVYLSATGATETYNLGYAHRLGIWGPGCAFAKASEFISRVDASGNAGRELVARDLKSRGVYLAAQLSFQGVEYDRLEHVLTEDQRMIYDTFARAWQSVIEHVDDALELVATRIKQGSRVTDSRAKGAAYSAFWSAHQRAFNQILSALMMTTVVADAEAEVARGNCCVFQIVNTYEAAMDRQLAKIAEEHGSLEDVDITPKEQLIQFIEHCFPTA